MTHVHQMRLLPWSDQMGRPCYVRSADGAGYVSRLADRVEAEQLEAGLRFACYANELLDDGEATRDDLLHLTNGLTASLCNALRIAKSRGDRLTTAEDAADTDE